MIIKLIKNEYLSIDYKYFLYFLCVISLIIYYGNYRCKHLKKHKDILEFSLFKNSNKYGLDGWSITHLLFYFFIGFLYPNTFIISMVMGLIWELIETYIGYYKPEYIRGYGFCKLTGNKYKVWWYGKWSDIIINITGFLLGSYMSYLK